METEWELLVSSEEIEKGDKLLVEEEDGNVSVLKLVKYTKTCVYLVDNDGNRRKFHTDDLSEIDGSSIIVGKA